jgi:hypothetical protein
MTTEISKLIEKLDKLTAELEKIGYPKEDDSHYLHDLSSSKHEEIYALVQEIEQEASGYMIIDSGRYAGQPDFTRHKTLKLMSNGKYHITKGETDSFGWLSGKLHTPRGIIVYG